MRLPAWVTVIVHYGDHSPASDSARIVDMRCLVLAMVLPVVALAADLDDIRATQQRLLAAKDPTKLPRDEVPLDEVALVKHQLLTWAESRLQSFGPNVETADLTKELSNELHGGVKSPSEEMDRLGELDLAFSRPEGEPSWLQMTTDVGIQCGVDRSVYLYEWRDNRWNRRFTLEANDYRKAEYGPQQFIELQISSADARGARLVLVTGLPPACMSVWHTLYIRLFRVDASQSLLVEETPLSNEGEDYSARLEPAGALIEFSGSSIDAAILIRKHVLHYRLDDDAVRRIDRIFTSGFCAGMANASLD
jgi:hypothetical protein